MGGNGPDTRNFVCGDGDTEAGSADEEGAVSFAFDDLPGGLDSDVRVGCLVGGVGNTDISDGGDERVVLEVGFDGLLVGVASVIAGNDDAEGSEGCVSGHFGSWCFGSS